MVGLELRVTFRDMLRDGLELGVISSLGLKLCDRLHKPPIHRIV